MELHEILYEERFSADVLSRFTKMILVFLVFFTMAANVCFSNPAAGQNISSAPETVLPISSDAESNVGLDEADALFVTELVLQPIISGSDKFMISADPASAVVFPAKVENGILDMLEKTAAAVPDESEATVPEGPALSVPDGPTAVIPEDTATVMPEEPEAIVPEDPAVSVPEEPTVPIPPENAVSESVTGVIDGFLVNESGIIYGISDPDLVVNDGYLEFPAEGCTGIAAGTFGGGLPSVREIFIPANITYIEEGAFSGLTNMEWFEMESTGAYYTEEGILFSESGTCLLAFPAGRTGNYKVPSHVERFAAGAFDSAQIEVLDATACTLTDVSGIPENISLLVRETP